MLPHTGIPHITWWKVTTTHSVLVRKTDLMPTDTEVSTMEIFLGVLKRIVDITEAIGGEKLVTISTIKPLLHKLLSVHLTVKSTDTALAKAI